MRRARERRGRAICGAATHREQTGLLQLHLELGLVLGHLLERRVELANARLLRAEVFLQLLVLARHGRELLGRRRLHRRLLARALQLASTGMQDHAEGHLRVQASAFGTIPGPIDHGVEVRLGVSRRKLAGNLLHVGFHRRLVGLQGRSLSALVLLQLGVCGGELGRGVVGARLSFLKRLLGDHVCDGRLGGGGVRVGHGGDARGAVVFRQCGWALLVMFSGEFGLAGHSPFLEKAATLCTTLSLMSVIHVPLRRPSSHKLNSF